jgi:hypothetical protein
MGNESVEPMAVEHVESGIYQISMVFIDRTWVRQYCGYGANVVHLHEVRILRVLVGVQKQSGIRGLSCVPIPETS